MEPGHFTDDFKRDAVARTTERGYPVAEVSTTTRWQKASSICSSASESAAKPIGRARRLGRTCSTASRCSTTPEASASGTGCCPPSSSNDNTTSSPTASTKLGTIDRQLLARTTGDFGQLPGSASMADPDVSLGEAPLAQPDASRKNSGGPIWPPFNTISSPSSRFPALCARQTGAPSTSGAR